MKDSENEKASLIVRRAEKMFASPERTNADDIWSLITEFMLTNQHGVFSNASEPKGAKRTTRVFDSTAIQSAADLAAAIHSVMTNPAAPWMRLRYIQEDLNDVPEAVAWLQDTEARIVDAFNSSNFTNEVSKGYKMFTTLGNMVLMHEQDDFDEEGDFNGLRFKALHLGEVAWSENARGIVDSVYRKFKLTARQAVERFGKNIMSNEKLVECLQEDPDKEFQFMHCIFPREKVKVELGEQVPGKKRPFASVYVDMSTKEIVDETGYYEFPIHVTRWETQPSEVYGRGPGHIALPDVRTLNRVKELGLHAINKAINPPVLVNQKSMFGSLDFRPGHVTVVRDLQGISTLPITSQFDVTQFAVEELRNSIKQIFFLDKLLLPPRTDTGEMTAFEIATRTEQMQRVLGPTLGRLNSELLDPLVKRAFAIMLRGRAFAPVPDVVAQQGGAIQIEYVNPLARSQRASDLTNIQQWVERLGMLAQVDPGAVDYIDTDMIAKHTAKVLGIPEEIIKNDEEVAAVRQQRQQMMQAQMALEAGTKMADMQAKSAQAQATQGGNGEGPETF